MDTWTHAGVLIAGSVALYAIIAAWIGVLDFGPRRVRALAMVFWPFTVIVLICLLPKLVYHCVLEEEREIARRRDGEEKIEEEV